jgi:transcriptional regulator with XRE-family HTH domain
MTDRQSTVRARELGEELRQIRERAGLRAIELARRLGWSPSKVSRMESGERPASEIDVAMYLTLCGVTGAELHRLLDLSRESDEGFSLRRHGARLPDELRTLAVEETTASAIRSFAPLLIPGLLQTEDYMRVVMHASVSVPEDGVEPRVAARLARQSLLRRRYRPPYLIFFVDEQVLRRPVGGPAVMHEQLLHLVFLTAQPHVTLRVVPLSAGAHAGMNGPFKLLEHIERSPVVYLENETSSLFLEDAKDIVAYRLILAKLADIALDEGQSRTFVADLANEYDRPRGDRDDHAGAGGDDVAEE